MAMQPISNPSAPPAEAVDDFEWISASLKPSAPSSDDSSHDLITPPMAIPDAIQQQLIYQRIMQQNKHNEQLANAAAEQKQPDILVDWSFGKGVASQPRQIAAEDIEKCPEPAGSYMAQDLHFAHRAQYTSSALCIWRRSPKGRGIELMMGCGSQSQCLSFIETSRADSDEDYIATATRALYQQTGSALDKETLSQITRALRTDKDRRTFWKDEWRSALLFFEMAYDYDLVQNFAQRRDWQSEFASLHWVSFESLFRSIFVDGSTISIKNASRLKPFVVGSLLHSENKDYLIDLHTKNGGDGSALLPKHGGTLRSTLKVFDAVPKVLRLDVRDPLTLQVMFHRWLDANLSDVEDQHLLHSLVASVCGELGNNFVLFDYSTKKEKGPLRVDTLPAFKTLKEKCRDTPSVSVVPTFLLADTFNGVRIGVKGGDVEMKINQHEGVKGASPLEFASGWFEGFGSDDGRWQYLSDANTFENFSAKISTSIERNFIKGTKGCTFHRFGVQYQVDFLAMTQKNLKTKHTRPIRRANSNAHQNYVPAQAQFGSYGSESFEKWQFMENDGAWKDLPVAASKQLNAFKSARVTHKWAYLARFDKINTTSVTINSRTYEIDVEHNYQRNTQTQNIRRVRQIRVAESSYVPTFAHHKGHKWQFQNDKHIWTDFASTASQRIERRFLKYSHRKPFTLETNGSQYRVDLAAMAQCNLTTHKRRAIRRVGHDSKFIASPNSNSVPVQHRWEWQDDDGSWKRYAKRISAQIETAKLGGIKKFFLSENGNSYSVDFAALTQSNVQTGKQRTVRRVPMAMAQRMAAKAKDTERRTFGEATAELFCVVGEAVAKEVRANKGQFARGTLGPFGAGLYFYEYAQMALQRAKERSAGNKGWLVKAKVLVGKERSVDGMGDWVCDFAVLQQMGCDSVSRSVGFGKECVVYNMDQVQVLSVERGS